VDELQALLQESGLSDYRVTALLLRGPTGTTALLPLRTFGTEVARPSPKASVRPSLDKSLSWKEWCRYRGISTGLGYQLLAQGRGPRTMIVGRRKRIVTPEADREWVERLERERGAP
jgi:hypothetical protein